MPTWWRSYGTLERDSEHFLIVFDPHDGFDSCPKPKAAPVPTSPTRTRPTRRRRVSKVSRAQAIFSILAILVVCALIGGTVGSAAIDALRNDNGDETSTVPDSSTNEDTELAAFQKAADAYPNDPAALASLANYLSQTGRTDESVRWYEKSLLIAPDDIAVRLDFARALAEGEKRTDAELQFQKVVGADPGNAQAHYSFAQLYANWIPPRRAEEIAEYEKVIQYGEDTYIADQAREQLAALGVATPTVAGTAVASPIASTGSAS